MDWKLGNKERNTEAGGQVKLDLVQEYRSCHQMGSVLLCLEHPAADFQAVEQNQNSCNKSCIEQHTGFLLKELFLTW